MAEWWLKKGYLQFRDPLVPFLNIAGPFAANNPGGAWSIDKNDGKTIEKISVFIFHLMKFWKALRSEELKADVSKNGTRFSMHQFRNLFNSARIPLIGQDELRHFWKTEKESSDSPIHAVVLRNGHAFVFNPVSTKSFEPKNPSKVQAILQKIKMAADQMEPGPGVAALTCDFRDKWAKNRERLLDLGEYSSIPCCKRKC